MSNPDIRTVFHPDRWRYLTPTEVTALQDWLGANGLDPRDVDRAPITIEQRDGQRVIRYTAFLRAEDGCKYRDPVTDRTAREERTVPLLVEPPEDWAQQ
ncbi:hypothetical protein [Streptomyces himastatinicus]|nr:hypothetical protein [Streptomyces himastatinicus]